jgi:carbon monoxide dehydrogenase subunit G
VVEVLERSYERTVRIKAPQRTLYGEMDSVEALARFLPQVDGLEPDPDPHIAVCFGAVSIGPLSYRLKGTLEVERVDPPNGLWLRLRATNVPMELEGRFDFTPSSAEETTLRYSATIRSDHKLIRRMRSSMLGVLEEHVDAAIDLAAVRGSQYAQAARLLSPDMHPQESDGLSGA